MPTSFDSPETPTSPEMRQEEVQMRRNLGLDQNSPTPLTPYATRHAERHQQPRRFVRDGEVPVVVLNRREAAADATPPQNRLAVAEGALKAETVARQRCERALAEAQTAVHELQTKIGHAHLARDEAVEAAGRLREEIARLRAELAVARTVRIEAEQTARKPRPIAARPEAEAKPEPEPALPRRRGRPKGSKNGVHMKPAKEPKPVKWW